MFAVDELLDNPDLLIATATKLKEERIARLEAEKKALLAEKEANFQKNIVEGLAGSIELYEVVVKVFATDVDRLVQEMYEVRSI